MTDTTDDAVKLTLPEAAALARKAGEDAARMRKEARDAEAAHMTTERQHTLVGCSDCGRGYPPKHMVSVGDDWLCTQCAGAEIGRLREALHLVMNEASSHIHPLDGWNASDCKIHRAAFYGLRGTETLWNKALAMGKAYMPEDSLFGYKPDEDSILAALGKEQP